MSYPSIFVRWNCSLNRTHSTAQHKKNGGVIHSWIHHRQRVISDFSNTERAGLIKVWFFPLFKSMLTYLTLDWCLITPAVQAAGSGQLRTGWRLRLWILQNFPYFWINMTNDVTQFSPNPETRWIQLNKLDKYTFLFLYKGDRVWCFNQWIKKISCPSNCHVNRVQIKTIQHNFFPAQQCSTSELSQKPQGNV